MSEAPVFANGAYTAAFQHLFNNERNALGRAKQKSIDFSEERFQEITGMSVEESIAAYKERGGTYDLTADTVETLFTNPVSAKKILMGDNDLHQIYRGVLNKNVPMNPTIARSLGYKKLGFFKNIFHQPFRNVKYVGPHGHMEAIYNKSTGTLNTSIRYGGSFNFFGPSNARAHTLADVGPYFAKGN